MPSDTAPADVTIDVRMGVLIVTTPDGKRRVVDRDTTGTITFNLPEPGNHPDAEKADVPWEPLQRAKRHVDGVPVPEPEGMTIWKNNLYTVQRTEHRWPGDPDAPEVVHLSIRRNDRHWARDWRHFQRIKNELVGPEHEGIELYPAESRMMDMANQYHLWVLKDPAARFPFGYEDGRVVASDGPDIGARQRPLTNGEVETVNPQQMADMARLFLDRSDPALREALDRALSDNAKPTDLGELGRTRVRFWMCPVEEHGERPGEVTVRWEGEVASCTFPGCPHTSAELVG